VSAPIFGAVAWNGALLVRTAAVLTRSVEAGVVLIGPAAPNPVVLSGSAAILWETLAIPRSAGAIVDDLAACYGVDTELIVGDVERALHELVALGLIELE
jgi:hypothetical protein